MIFFFRFMSIFHDVPCSSSYFPKPHRLSKQFLCWVPSLKKVTFTQARCDWLTKKINLASEEGSRKNYSFSLFFVYKRTKKKSKKVFWKNWKLSSFVGYICYLHNKENGSGLNEMRKQTCGGNGSIIEEIPPLKITYCYFSFYLYYSSIVLASPLNPNVVGLNNKDEFSIEAVSMSYWNR